MIVAASTFSPCAALGYTAPGKYPINLFRANPFVNNINYIDDNGNSNYNALQLTAEKRLSQGLTMLIGPPPDLCRSKRRSSEAILCRA